MIEELAAIVEWVPTESIKPHPKNPNSHDDEQIERLAKLIQFHGWRNPLIVSHSSGLLIAGHGRLAAAQLLGLKSVPVLRQRFKDSEAEYQYLIADNSSAAWASLDFAAINAEIGNMGPFDIDMLGIKDFTVDMAEKDSEGDEPSPKEPVMLECPSCKHRWLK